MDMRASSLNSFCSWLVNRSQCITATWPWVSELRLMVPNRLQLTDTHGSCFFKQNIWNFNKPSAWSYNERVALKINFHFKISFVVSLYKQVKITFLLCNALFVVSDLISLRISTRDIDPTTIELADGKQNIDPNIKLREYWILEARSAAERLKS